MDFLNSPPPTPSSHLEYVTATNKPTSGEVIKQKVFQMMTQLEGWCSEDKASILIDLISITKPMVIVEIGVFGGKSLIPMAYALKENGMGKIYGIDPWSNVASAEGMDGPNKEYWNNLDHERIMQELIRKITEFKLQNQVELIRSTSELAPSIPEIDILHIDGNHSNKAAFIDINKWVPLVKKGGMIIFDDIGWAGNQRPAKWFDKHCLPFARFKGDNMWGIWIKP